MSEDNPSHSNINQGLQLFEFDSSLLDMKYTVNTGVTSDNNNVRLGQTEPSPVTPCHYI